MKTINELVEEVKVSQTNNISYRDADTVLADILDDCDVEVSDTGLELILIWEKSNDKKSVEDTFQSLTGISFREYLERSIKALEETKAN